MQMIFILFADKNLMRQHVNPLSNIFKDITPIPSLEEIFIDPEKPLHIDIGCGSGRYLLELAMQNKDWNYIGIEIRKKLVLDAKLKLKNESINNLFFAFGNAEYLIGDFINKLSKNSLFSVSFNFPDPWFKTRHHKRRVLQPKLIDNISQIIVFGGFIIIKSDVKELFREMEIVILKSEKFIKHKYENHELIHSHNPNKLKTSREIYVTKKNLDIYECIYKKI
tara:strand:+ start:1583 stop:2251 length:669 start_codon:yes stop_codon:yes gene_type:complete